MARSKGNSISNWFLSGLFKLGMILAIVILMVYLIGMTLHSVAPRCILHGVPNTNWFTIIVLGVIILLLKRAADKF